MTSNSGLKGGAWRAYFQFALLARLSKLARGVSLWSAEWPHVEDDDA